MSNISKVLSDVFFGTPQSKYAAIAYFLTIAIICFAVLFSSSDVPIEQRFVVVMFILIITIPSVLFSLFELTCIVTGGNKNTRWWCYWLAWFLSILLIVYCLFIIISLFFSMASYDLAVSRINDNENDNKISQTDANDYAKDIMKQYEDDKEDGNVTKEPEMQQPQMQQPQMQQPEMQPEMQPEIPRPPQMQPSVTNPVMSNDQNMFIDFEKMGYDKDDNYAPISNTSSDMSYGFSSANKLNNDYLHSNRTLPNQNMFEPEPFENDNNLENFFGVPDYRNQKKVDLKKRQKIQACIRQKCEGKEGKDLNSCMLLLCNNN